MLCDACRHSMSNTSSFCIKCVCFCVLENLGNTSGMNQLSFPNTNLFYTNSTIIFNNPSKESTFSLLNQNMDMWSNNNNTWLIKYCDLYSLIAMTQTNPKSLMRKNTWSMILNIFLNVGVVVILKVEHQPGFYVQKACL